MAYDVKRLAGQFVDWIVDRYPEAILNYYPPYLGAGIEVESISEQFRRIEVRMPLEWYNQNYVGTQFGGSLYSMCDPFYMLILMRNLGDEYIVWDKAAEIQFRRPGTDTVRACFEVGEARLDNIRSEVAEHGVCEPKFDIEIVGTSGEIVAEVTKTLHVRRADESESPGSSSRAKPN